MTNSANPAAKAWPINRRIWEILSSPNMVLFISANIVNVGNLAFNVLFSRWMGPTLFGDLALLLTVKLSLLSILNALQFEIAGRVARIKDQAFHDAAGQHINKINKFLIGGGFLMLLAAGGIWLWFIISQNGGLPSQGPHSSSTLTFVLFALCLPFMTPMILARGCVQGTQDLKAIVWSFQAEMTVRLLGSAVAWHIGAGLEGIALAIALSILVGWHYSRPNSRITQKTKRAHANTTAHPQTLENAGSQAQTLKNVRRQFALPGLMLACLPWASLQLGQVLALDGEFIVAKLTMDADQGGMMAITSLIQRILFFGCFGLATAILPIAAAIRTKDEMISALRPVVGLLALVCLPAIFVFQFFPELFIGLIFGENFINVSNNIIYSGISGSIFIVIYIISTVFLAKSVKYFGYAVLLFSFTQLIGLFTLVTIWPEPSLHALVVTKAAFQSVFLIIFIGAAYHEFTKLD